MGNPEFSLQRADNMETVAAIVQETIQAVYPRYYPQGAVDFFRELHSLNRLCQAQEEEEIYLLSVEGTGAGTCSVRGNEICRFFMLPPYQHRGYGQKIMDILEGKICRQYDTVHVDASFPAEEMYLRRGYRIVSYEKIETVNGDFLCYHTMVKQLRSERIKAER